MAGPVFYGGVAGFCGGLADFSCSAWSAYQTVAGPEEAAVATFLFAVGVQDDVGAATFGADGAWVHGGEFFYRVV